MAPAPLKGLRIGVPAQLMTNLAPEVERVTAAAFARLEAEGVTMVRVDMPEIRQSLDVFVAILLFEGRPAITRFLEDEGTGVTFEQLLAASGDDIRMRPPPREVYEGALKARDVVQARVRALFAEHQITTLAYPAVFEDAPRIGDWPDATWAGETVPHGGMVLWSTFLAPCCGHPGLVVPAGLSAAGLPIGLEFDAPAGTDRQLLGLGLAVEQALGPIPAPGVSQER